MTSHATHQASVTEQPSTFKQLVQETSAADPSGHKWLGMHFRTGSMVISFVMVLFYGYCGLSILAFTNLMEFSGSFTGLIATMGALFFILAGFSLYGFIGIQQFNGRWTRHYIRFYLAGVGAWFVLEIASMTIQVLFRQKFNRESSLCTEEDACRTFSFAGWGPTMGVGLLFQLYFGACLSKYKRMMNREGGMEDPFKRTIAGF